MISEAADQVLHFGKRKIVYRLSTSDRKRLRISVRPDLSVTVNAPLGQSAEAIERAVESKAYWIARKLDELSEFHPLPTPHRYVGGETFVYLGRQYRLKIQEGETSPAKLRGRFLRIQIPDKVDSQMIRGAVDDWYRNRALDVFPKAMERCLKIASRQGATEPTLSIRKMRTRWGSCSASNRVTLNLYLILAPLHCIDYVVMHELCHLVEHNHSSAFYRLLTRCMPDWKKRRQVLREVLIPGYDPGGIGN